MTKVHKEVCDPHVVHISRNVLNNFFYRNLGLYLVNLIQIFIFIFENT